MEQNNNSPPTNLSGMSLKLLNIIVLIKKLYPNISQLELHKVLYISYCAYMEEFDKELFKEKFEAWTYGPVIEKVYDHIDKEDRVNTDYLLKHQTILQYYPPFLPSSEKEYLINGIKKIYDSNNVFGLIEITHQDKCWYSTHYLSEISKDKLRAHHTKANQSEMPWNQYFNSDLHIFKGFFPNYDNQLSARVLNDFEREMKKQISAFNTKNKKNQKENN